MLDEVKQETSRKLKSIQQLPFLTSDPTSDAKSTPDPSVRHKLQPKETFHNFRFNQQPPINHNTADLQPNSQIEHQSSKNKDQHVTCRNKTLNSRINVNQLEITQIIRKLTEVHR